MSASWYGQAPAPAPRDTVARNPGDRSTESMSGSFDDYNQKAVTVSTVLGVAPPSVCSSGLCRNHGETRVKLRALTNKVVSVDDSSQRATGRSRAC